MHALSYSNIGPRLVFEDDGSLRFADEFHYWKFVFRMIVGKSIGTTLYMNCSLPAAMLLTWYFSWIMIECMLIVTAIIVVSFMVTNAGMYMMYRRAVYKTRQREIERQGQGV